MELIDGIPPGLRTTWIRPRRLEASLIATSTIRRTLGFAIFETMAGDPVALDVDLLPASLVDSAHAFADGDDVGGRDDLGPDLAGLPRLDQRFDGSELAIKVELAADLVDEAVAARSAEQCAPAIEDIARKIDHFGRQAAAVDFLGSQADETAFVQFEAPGRRTASVSRAATSRPARLPARRPRQGKRRYDGPAPDHSRGRGCAGSPQAAASAAPQHLAWHHGLGSSGS